MPFADRHTAAIDDIDQTGPWSKFRIDEPRKCLGLLRDLRVGDIAMVLGAPRGPAMAVTLWAVDDLAARLHFSAEALTRGIEDLMARPGLWAAANLGGAKLQFPVNGLVAGESPMAPGLGGGARIGLQAALPSHVYSLPRRSTLRLRQGRHRGPRLRFRHPLVPDTVLWLSALDISDAGCALWKPASELPLVPGARIDGVEVQLDDETVFFVDIVVQHVTRQSNDPDSGARIGCSWHNMPSSGRETLGRWLRAGSGPSPFITLSLG